ncbi:MAG: hypothetical protein PVG93_01265 [Phycisphaerales bacterium]|jgi:uncharacterized membrane protein YhaH (DUF805 family)
MDCSGPCDPEAVSVFIAIAAAAFTIFLGLVVTIVTALIFCKIFHKAGFHWALGLLMVVPVANVIMPFYLAFSDWPIQKELRAMKQSAAGAEKT